MSGTVEEINQLIAAGKPVMLYRSLAPVALDYYREQYDQLQDGLARYRVRGSSSNTEASTSFDLFRKHLAMTIIRAFKAVSTHVESPTQCCA